MRTWHYPTMKMAKAFWDSMYSTPQHSQIYLSLWEQKYTPTYTPGWLSGVNTPQTYLETVVCNTSLGDSSFGNRVMQEILAISISVPGTSCPPSGSSGPGCRVRKHWPVDGVLCCATVKQLRPLIHGMYCVPILLKRSTWHLVTTVPGHTLPVHLSPLPNSPYEVCSFC